MSVSVSCALRSSRLHSLRFHFHFVSVGVCVLVSFRVVSFLFCLVLGAVAGPNELSSQRCKCVAGHRQAKHEMEARCATSNDKRNMKWKH
jgi:hypothetical protein